MTDSDTSSTKKPIPPPGERSFDRLAKEWEQEPSGPVLFKPDELDIMVEKLTNEAIIFHGKTIDYEALDRMEYDPKDHSVTVFKKDGTQLDLGVKIQWLIRAYFKEATIIQIMRTENGQAVDGTAIPLINLGKAAKKE